MATKDRKGLSPMDIVAVLTKVVQEQERVNEEQRKMIEEQRKSALKQQDSIEMLSGKVDRLERELRLKGAQAKVGRE